MFQSMCHGLWNVLFFLLSAALLFLLFILLILSHQATYSMDFHLLPCLCQGSPQRLTAFFRSLFLSFLTSLYLFPYIVLFPQVFFLPGRVRWRGSVTVWDFFFHLCLRSISPYFKKRKLFPSLTGINPVRRFSQPQVAFPSSDTEVFCSKRKS